MKIRSILFGNRINVYRSIYIFLNLSTVFQAAYENSKQKLIILKSSTIFGFEFLTYFWSGIFSDKLRSFWRRAI
jgi:hypothetical protein